MDKDRHTNVFTRPINFKAPISGAGVLILVVIALGLFLGNYHVVSDAPRPILKRPYFGFSDTFASAKVCTTGPWILVKAQHPSLCLAAQNAGLIETDVEYRRRVKQENVDRALEREACTSKCDIRSRNYLSCMAAC